jgi:hypothetical protein
VARSYSESFLIDLNKNTSTGLGVALAKVCVAANLPASYVSEALDVSRMTVYSWFRGRGIREEYHIRVEAFMNLVKQDMEVGRLPAENMKAAREYISEMVSAPAT